MEVDLGCIFEYRVAMKHVLRDGPNREGCCSIQGNATAAVNNIH